MVLGDDGPAVGQQAHVALARVHHRLDGEGHTRLELEPGAGLAVVQHLRVFVIHTPDAVAAVLAHHRVVVFLDEALDGVTDVAQVRTRTYRLDAAPHGGEAGLGEALRGRQRLAHQVHAAGVAVKSVADHGDVDIDDVAGLQALVIRDAVADHVVHRGADGLGKTAVVEVRRHRALYVHDMVVADAVELLGRHPRHHVLRDHVEHLRGQAPGDAHLFRFLGGLDGDVHGMRNGVAAP